MGFVYYNPNPLNKSVGDCVIRAISKATNKDWKTVYIEVALEGLIMANMPSANDVWGAYLRKNGFRRYVIPNSCPDCYTVRDFCADNPDGTFILAIGDHVVAVERGSYFDSWDSGSEVPVYFWTREISERGDYV